MKTKLPKKLLVTLLAAYASAAPSFSETIDNTSKEYATSQTTSENLAITNGGSLSITSGAVYDMTAAGTFQVQKGGKLTVSEGTFKGGSNNFWLYEGEVNVDGSNSTAEVCRGESAQNYRALVGLGEDSANINVTNGGTFISSASQFVTNYYSGTTVNINVDGSGSTFTQTAKTVKAHYYPIGSSGEWVWHDQSYKTDGSVHRYEGYYDKDSTLGGVKYDAQGPTITYLCDSGTDKSGCHYDARANCTTNISATNGGQVVFDSVLTYIGGILDKAAGVNATKSANFTIGEDSSISFNRTEVYTQVNIDNAGTFTINGALTLNDGAKLTLHNDVSTGTVNISGGLIVKAGAELEITANSRENEIVMLFGDASTDELLSTTLNADLYLEDNSILKLTGTTLNLKNNDLVMGDNVSIVLSDDMLDTTGSVTLFSGVSSMLDTEGNAITSFKINGGNNEVSIDGAGNVVITECVPEPATATLSLLALAGLCARRRRK
ncbi:MAG: PEP-CTERM sorting domain-containing protein [Akkermansia sp.]|nr:PEP-CTERM sorting domain-containing protein [Akkermansia sp.]